MSTIFTHTAVPLVIGPGIGGKTIPPGLVAVGCLPAILPDIIGIRHFFNRWGLYVLKTEPVRVLVPLIAIGITLRPGRVFYRIHSVGHHSWGVK